MHLWFVPSKNPVKHIFSFICKDRPVWFIICSILPSVLWAPTVHTLYETSNNHILCCMLNHGNTLMQLLHCLSLSSCQLDSALPPAAQLLCCNLNRATWSGIICDFRTSLTEFLNPVVNRFTQQILPTMNRKHVFVDILTLSPFAHKRMHNVMLLFNGILMKHSHYFDYWKTSEHAYTHLLPKLSWNWTVLLRSDTHRKRITSITAVLLPFVIYLLTLPSSMVPQPICPCGSLPHCSRRYRIGAQKL
jgi:hypothetical protein